jgi:predicted DNA-binding protein
MATAIVQYSLHHPQESQQALDELSKTQAADMAYQIAEIYAWRGGVHMAGPRFRTT